MSDIEVRFIPQAWVDDEAVDVDPEGEVVFRVPKAAVKGIEPYSRESDELRDHPNAPQWVKDWHGPYSVTWDEDEVDE